MRSTGSGDDYQTLHLPNHVMRERARVNAVTVESLRRVTGYIKPIYVDHLEDGRRVAALGERDHARVREGYACGECLATFNSRERFCPGCGHQLDTSVDLVDFLPDYWKPDPRKTAEIPTLFDKDVAD